LDERVVNLCADLPVEVGFTAVELGEYTVSLRTVSPEEDAPSPDAPEVDVTYNPLKTAYDEETGETEVTAPIHVEDPDRNPVPEADVDLVLSTPDDLH
jgi:hypothetical protein